MNLKVALGAAIPARTESNLLVATWNIRGRTPYFASFSGAGTEFTLASGTANRLRAAMAAHGRPPDDTEVRGVEAMARGLGRSQPL
jgi:hypothetical protein